jgi:hypothetical protein
MEEPTYEVRTVDALAGFRWIWDALNIGRRGARAIFGGAGLLLLTAIGAGIATVIVMGGVLAAVRGSQSMMMVVTFGFMAFMVLGMSFALVGYLRLVDAVESGRSARATDAFRGFTDPRAGGGAFVILLAIMVLQQALMIGLVAWLLPDLGRWYLDVLHDAAAAGQPPVLPSAFWKFYPASLLLNMVGSWVQAIAIGQVAIRGRSIAGALRDGVVGLLRNLPALLVLIVAAIVFAVAILLAVLLAAVLVVAIAKLVAMWLAVVLAVLLYLAFLVATIAVGCASMYYMWRDVAGPGATPSPAAVEA